MCLGPSFSRPCSRLLPLRNLRRVPPLWTKWFLYEHCLSSIVYCTLLLFLSSVNATATLFHTSLLKEIMTEVAAISHFSFNWPISSWILKCVVQCWEPTSIEGEEFGWWFLIIKLWLLHCKLLHVILFTSF